MAETLILNNGLKVVHRRVENKLAHCALMIKAGSRNEQKNEHGLAHFTEHMLFKGTAKRSGSAIIRRLEDVGGETNAYTSKEETCLHATFMHRYYERAIELLHDIMFNSRFPETEIEKEKNVITDEINSYLDNPSEIIFDEFESMLFPNNPLGRPILGTNKSLSAFNQNSFLKFTERNYSVNNMVLSSVGNISFDDLINLTKKYIGDIGSKKRTKKNIPAETYHPQNIIRNKKTFQCHNIIGTRAYGLHDKNRPAMALLNNYLGGPGLSAQLNIVLREKKGLCYTVESSYMPYTGTGAFTIYIGGEKNMLNKNIELVQQELKKLMIKKISCSRLAIAKRQIIGLITSSYENNESRMLSNAKSFLNNNRIYSYKELCHNIENVTSLQILDIANEIFDEKKLSYLTYK